MLGGCSEYYFDRRDTITLYSGDAVATNRVTQMIDPWPVASGRHNIAYSGEKAATASERYRIGRVIPPINATTSSAAYVGAQQAAPLPVTNQPSSPPNNANNSSSSQTK
jgi:hypothetical protein